jgi:hypothetical protein
MSTFLYSGFIPSCCRWHAFIRACARTASTLRVMRTRSLGRDHLLVTYLNAFVRWWSIRLAIVFELSVCVYTSATLKTWFVIIATLWCCKSISELLWNVNMWCVMWNDAILVVSKLVWNSSWFRLTTGIIWVQVWKFERFGACFCTCALIIWSVLLHVESSYFFIAAEPWASP